MAGGFWPRSSREWMGKKAGKCRVEYAIFITVYALHTQSQHNKVNTHRTKDEQWGDGRWVVSPGCLCRFN